jgi:hypothetical protein
MKKKTCAILSATFAFSVFGTSFAAEAKVQNLPATQWSYEAVSYLGQAGIIDGYNDQTLRSHPNMTRNEMAEIVYKAMQNESKANIAQKALIDKLASEYALEINKINTVDNQSSKDEKKLADISISGSLLEQYKIKSVPHADANYKGYSKQQWQLRLNFSAKVDDKTTFNVRLANPAPTKEVFEDVTAKFGGVNSDNTLKADRFFATTRIGTTEVTLGRQALAIDPEDAIVDSGFFSYDGAKVALNWKGLNFDIKYGRFAEGVIGYAFGSGITTNAADFNDIEIYSASVGAKRGNLKWNTGWVKFKNWQLSKNLMNYYFGHVGYQFNNRFSMAAEYGKNTEASYDGAYWFLKGVYGAQSLNTANKQNFTMQYLHASQNSLNGCYTGFDDQAHVDTNDGTNGHAWNVLDFAYRYAFSHNMVGKLEYGKIMDKQNAKEDYNFYKFQLIYKI